jgi:hypothetical protein
MTPEWKNGVMEYRKVGFFKRILFFFNFIFNTNFTIKPKFHYTRTPGPDRDKISEIIKISCLKAL